MRLCAVVCSLCVQSTEVVKLSLLNKKNVFLDVSASFRCRCQDVNLPVPGREPLLRENVWTQIPTWLGSVFSPVHCGLLHVGVFIFTSPEGEIFPHSARERRLDLHHVELDVVAHKPVGDAGGVQVREGRI